MILIGAYEIVGCVEGFYYAFAKEGVHKAVVTLAFDNYAVAFKELAPSVVFTCNGVNDLA